MQYFAFCSDGSLLCDSFVATFFGIYLAIALIPAAIIYFIYKYRAWIGQNLIIFMAGVLVVGLLFVGLMSSEMGRTLFLYMIPFVFLPSLVLSWAYVEQNKANLLKSHKMNHLELNVLRGLALVAFIILLLNFLA